tara:strand:+ start:42 stop:323 length:282 start_codon:yes stop_codon:yes gene_type:complete
MSELEIFKQFVDGMWEMTFGTERRTEGRYKADDKSTTDVNENWISPFPTPEPSMKWTRKQINDYCNEFGVLHSEYDNKKQLLEKIEETYPNGL